MSSTLTLGSLSMSLTGTKTLRTPSSTKLSCDKLSTRPRIGGRLVMVRAQQNQATSNFSMQDDYATLGVSRLATKQEMKKRYRRLALELHPDVCKGDHCSTKFQQVTRAYENLVKGGGQSASGQFDDVSNCENDVDGMMGVGDDNWDEWEEWMGWEGAGTYDYSTLVNPNVI